MDDNNINSVNNKELTTTTTGNESPSETPIDDHVSNSKLTSEGESSNTSGTNPESPIDNHVFTTMLKLEGESSNTPSQEDRKSITGTPTSTPEGRKSITNTPGTVGKDSAVLAKDWGQLGKIMNSLFNYNNNFYR